MIDLTIQTFELWLAIQPDYETVGFSTDPCDCPLARFVKSQGPKEVSITTWHIEVGGPSGSSYETPDWTRLFMTEIDAHESLSPIRAFVARRALADVKRLYG